MSELNTTSPEIAQQPINPNEDIQSLVGSVDISVFQERLSPILTNPSIKELLVKELKENQPLTGGLMLSRIIKRIENTQVEQKDAQVEQKDAQVEQKDAQVEQKDAQVKEEKAQINETSIQRFESAKLATTDVTKVFATIETSLPAEKKAEISSTINTRLTDIKNGNIPSETKDFLNQIGANTPEAIVSPEVQSILTAHISTRVYLENRDSILKTNPKLEEQFNNLDRNKYALGISGKFEARDISEALSDFPKSEKDPIIANVTSLTRDNPNTIITRTGDKLTWEGEKEGEKFEIDMSVHPPKLSKSQDNLSISRTEVPENPELKGARESLDRSKNAYQEASKDIHGDLKSAGYYQNLDNFSIEEVEKAFSGGQFDTYREKMQSARTPEEQEKLRQEIHEQGEQSEGKLTKVGFSYMEQILSEKIEMGKIGVENAGGETATEQDLSKKLSALENLKSSDKLTKYTEARRKYEKEQEAIKKIETPGVDTFSEDASETLTLLNSLGYGELGQSGLNDLLEAMNLHNKGTVEPIDLNRNPKLDKTQEKSLRNLSEDILQRFQENAEKKGKTAPTNFREFWQGINIGLKDTNFRAQNWNTREKREQFLFQNPEAKKTPERPEESTK